MIQLPRLHPALPNVFPDPTSALAEPNGLLAFGGDLSVERLVAAYSQGVFPWFNDDEPILWWSPDPRCIFRTDQLHVSRSLRRQLRRDGWTVTFDRAFGAVMRACAAPRADQPGTWIGEDMIRAYNDLHARGFAHSVEVWSEEGLVGGLYGVAIGRLFCGESMFSIRTGGSKAALVGLCDLLQAWEFPLLDAQVTNDHLLRMGAIEIPRASFIRQARHLSALPGRPGSWANASR
ncbi:leucyl/phenylalanyl-tRNA--protein transferase [Luteibacter sp. Sphag1AF]|uniref:leucyl/phenylalanyl-tRNA--protein transferase n=1 Tax=Luteibacter sp. Sphag1AF TaxID=2587031 RepID=UPI00161ACBFE|nr:leucyl/phenylalanyl-tRNA--protein transferase [Luteibacter sp. Sphag1AF]MBB3228796.1 leucyl/phenylalanyl-tRNA--protein transferase [Luteibacter sp. Sphag1AF]